MLEDALKCSSLKLLVQISSSEIDYGKVEGSGQLSGKLEIGLHTRTAISVQVLAKSGCEPL